MNSHRKYKIITRHELTMNKALIFILVLSLFLSSEISARSKGSGSHYKSSGHSSRTSSRFSSRSSRTSNRSVSPRSFSTRKKVRAFTASLNSSKSHKSTYCTNCKRDSHGKIARSMDAKKSFMKQSGFIPNPLHFSKMPYGHRVTVSP